MCNLRCLWLAAVAFGLVAGGCDDFATPATLERTQILAVRAEPPSVAVGERTELIALVAGPDGVVAQPELQWQVVANAPGDEPVGRIETEDDRVYFRAPESVDDEPSFASVELTLQQESDQRVALKLIPIGNLPLQNPQLTAIRVDGGVVEEGALIELPVAAEVELQAETAPEAPDGSSFAWYATVGELSNYIFNPAQLQTAPEAESGWLIVVYRDGLGGVDWRVESAVLR